MALNEAIWDPKSLIRVLPPLMLGLRKAHNVLNSCKGSDQVSGRWFGIARAAERICGCDGCSYIMGKSKRDRERERKTEEGRGPKKVVHPSLPTSLLSDAH